MFSFRQKKNSSADAGSLSKSSDAEGIIEATKSYVIGSLKNQEITRSYFSTAESLISRFLLPSTLSLSAAESVIASPSGSPVLRRLMAPPKDLRKSRLCTALTPIASCAEVLNSFRAPIETFSNFKAKAVDDKVVIAKNNADGVLYAIKGIQRCDMGSCMNYVTVLPQSVPFMVELKMFYETESAYYLVLQRLRCGKLWNFLKTLSVVCNESFSPSEADSSSKFPRSLSVEVVNVLGHYVEDFLPEFQLLIRRSFRNVPEFCIRIWAAEILLALESLHEQGLVWCDLNPSNILLHHTGHITLTYFSMFVGKDVEKPYDCVRTMYSAPELLDYHDPTPAADWWSFGVLLYELLVGEPLAWNMASGGSVLSIQFRDWLTEEAKDLVGRLLEMNPHERLGAGTCGAEEVKAHPFFHPIDWEHLNEVALHLNSLE